MSSVENTNDRHLKWGVYAKNIGYILLALLIFLFALDLMISSFQQLGKTAAETILLATSNPFTALFIGLLITAIIQSSSATTSMVVALVASGSLSLESALPIIMGANIGTTITSTIVSLGFIAKRKEFIRAVSAGTYHDFFNILTITLLFPIEYYYGLVSSLSQYLATTFFHEPIASSTNNISFLGTGFTAIIQLLVDGINNGFVLTLLSFGLLFGSILFFRKVLTDLLGFDSENSVQRFFFQNKFKSFGWGLVATATIRSSTITTSLVVPLVAKKVVKLKDAAPFILGANIGTTITAFIASAFNSNVAISIAVAHFLINLFGVILFLFTPFIKELPLKLSMGLGRLTRKYRLAGFLYILVVFFFLPFSLIYLHKEQVNVIEATYRKTDHITDKNTKYTIVIRDGNHLSESIWMVYNDSSLNKSPSQILSVYNRKKMIIIDNELFEFKSPGYCRDNEINDKIYQLCVQEIVPAYETHSIHFDSVYVFSQTPLNAIGPDSTSALLYISLDKSLLVKKQRFDQKGALIETDELIRLEIK
ncbi:MAG TPA: hypothetical protein DIW27_05400 [Cytophagales bacterium]|nr:hypothetical protein [Cytophagales bacterium]